jgi:hypothetical protein
MDVESHMEFQSRGWQSYFNPRLTETLNITKTTVAKQLKNHRPEFLTLMTAKLQIVQDVLLLGYDVLLTDVDIVFHKNVIPEVLEKCKDMCFMHDGQGRGGGAYNHRHSAAIPGNTSIAPQVKSRNKIKWRTRDVV